MKQTDGVLSKADVKLSLDADSGATANGTEKNKVTATLSSGGSLLSGKTVSFMVTGSAHFDNDLQLTSATTSVFGEAVVNLKDKKSETVTVTAAYESTQAQAESTFGNGEGGDGDRDITVYLEYKDFNLSNICDDYYFEAGKTYRITFPESLGKIIHYRAPLDYHFDSNLGKTVYGPAEYNNDGPLTGNIYRDTFVMNKSGVLGYITTTMFYRRENIVSGMYTFRFEVV